MFSDQHKFHVGQSFYYQWNKKMCFQAYDTLKSCVAQHDNENKYRCPDELFAYEQWCPTDFQANMRQRNRQEKLDKIVYDQEFLDTLHKQKQSIYSERYQFSSLFKEVHS